MASETNNGKNGGLLKGKRHEDKNGNPLGGIKAIVTDTNQVVELEGGEVIINREASKKHWKELSRINQSAGNGVPILPPDKALADTEEYKNGGNTIEFNPNKIPNKWIYEYAKKIKEKYPKVWGLGGNQFGNEAFLNLERALRRGYWTENEEWMYVKWQSFNARHKQDFRIEGVIANLKWLNKVNKGWDYMKALIEKEIEKQYPTGWKHKKKNGGELAKGIKTEKEHSSTLKKVYEHKINPKDALKFVAKDHLKENPRYYSKLDEMEGKFATGGKLPDLTQVQVDANSFRPDGSRADDEPTLNAERGVIEIGFRHLGNWVDDEEDEQEDYEDNDNRIWAGGQYTKYKRLFEVWAEKYDWYKYAKLDIQTGEKDWAYFYIKIEKAEVKKEESKTTPPPSNATPPKTKVKKERKPPMFKVGDYFTTKATGDTLFLINSTKDIKVHYNDVIKPSTKGSYALSTFFAMIRKGEVTIQKGAPKEKEKFEFNVGDWFYEVGFEDEPFVVTVISGDEIGFGDFEGDNNPPKAKYTIPKATNKVIDGLWKREDKPRKKDETKYKVGDYFKTKTSSTDLYKITKIDKTLVTYLIVDGDREGNESNRVKKDFDGFIDSGSWFIVPPPNSGSVKFKKGDLVINKTNQTFLGQVLNVFVQKDGTEKYQIMLTDGTYYSDVFSYAWKFADDEDLEKLFVDRTLISKKVGEVEIVTLAQHEPKIYSIYTTKNYHFDYSGSDLFDLLSGLEVHDDRLKKENSGTKPLYKMGDIVVAEWSGTGNYRIAKINSIDFGKGLENYSVVFLVGGEKDVTQKQIKGLADADDMMSLIFRKLEDKYIVNTNDKPVISYKIEDWQIRPIEQATRIDIKVIDPTTKKDVIFDFSPLEVFNLLLDLNGTNGVDGFLLRDDNYKEENKDTKAEYKIDDYIVIKGESTGGQRALGKIVDVFAPKFNDKTYETKFVVGSTGWFKDDDILREATAEDFEALSLPRLLGKTLLIDGKGDAEIVGWTRITDSIWQITIDDAENTDYYDFTKDVIFKLLSGNEAQNKTNTFKLKAKEAKEELKDTSDFEFVQKTPTGTKTKLTYLQQVLVRSKQFKAWFGDWETASKNYIANGKKDFNKDFENVSKVMDMETLEPRVVYHGTPRKEEFFVFNTKATGLNRPYAYFAHNIEYSKNFHSENKKVLYECFLNVRTPFRAEGKGYEQKRESASYWEEKIIGTIAWDKYGALKKTDAGALEVKKTASAMGNYLQALAGNNAPFWKIMSFDIIGLFKAFLQYYKYDGMFYSEEFKDRYDANNPAEFTKAVCVFEPNQIKLADGRNLTFDGNNPDIRYEVGGEIEEQKNEHSLNRKHKLGSSLFGKQFALGGNLEPESQNNRVVETSPPKRDSESTIFVNDLINKMNQ